MGSGIAVENSIGNLWRKKSYRSGKWGESGGGDGCSDEMESLGEKRGRCKRDRGREGEGALKIVGPRATRKHKRGCSHCASRPATKPKMKELMVKRAEGETGRMVALHYQRFSNPGEQVYGWETQEGGSSEPEIRPGGLTHDGRKRRRQSGFNVRKM